MFLNKLKEENSKLLSFAIDSHQSGIILPNTYVLDYDMIIENAKVMLSAAKSEGIQLFFMLKQIGRNPIIARALTDLGYDGCVAVDYDEALTMIKHNIPLGNVGHLVQVPKKIIKKILQSKPQVITVYSFEKIMEINEVAKELNMIQPLLIRISDDDADLYSGQLGGFQSNDLNELLEKINELENVEFGGLTIFPALLFETDKNDIVETKNMLGIKRAINIVNELGYKNYMVNLPSATCCKSIPTIKKLGGNCGEPGHALTGTTPFHANNKAEEKIAYIYVSEISHNFKGKSYCYGGGYYRRGHLENVFVGKNLNELKELKITKPSGDSIDYHYEINEECKVSSSALMCFRTQIFTTRSHVVVVKGLSKNNPEIIGFYNALGDQIEESWK